MAELTGARCYAVRGGPVLYFGAPFPLTHSPFIPRNKFRNGIIYYRFTSG